jgi:PAS domain S-box-containing protein
MDVTGPPVRDDSRQASEARFRRVADTMPIIVWTATPDGAVDWSNQWMRQYTGFPEDGDLATGWLDTVHPDDHEPTLAAWRAALESGDPYETEFRIVRASDGVFRWHAVRAFAVHDEEGRTVHWYGTAMDIHAGKEMLDALATSEERFRLLAEATADAVWDWDPGRDVSWWGGGLRTLFGHDAAATLEDRDFWSRHVHPDDRDEVRASLEAVLATSDVWEAEYRFRRSDGTYAIVSDRGYVIRDSAGTPTRMVGGMTDISHQRRLEEQLRQAQRLEAVGQLTGGVAHDFNNLLTVILGNAELLVEELGPDDERRVLAEMTMDAARRGADLTHRLLAFARRQALEPRVVDVNHLVAGMDKLLRRTLGEHIDIEFGRAAALRPALVDPGQLEAAVLNLAINARDAMPLGGRLTIETGTASLDADYAERHVDVTPGTYVMIAVSDTGSGIEPDVLPRVFDPFFTTKGSGAGTGLGLSMVYGFVKQSGGHVKIYSERGEGTTVRLYLPRARRSEEADAAAPETTPRGGTEVILLVEDDDLVRRYAEDQLRGLGYTVRSASNGTEALDVIGTFADIDLLFTDVVMPGGMNGRRLADAALAALPRLRVLFTSGYTADAIVHHGRLDEGVHLLSKPYRRGDLARAVRAALDE